MLASCFVDRKVELPAAAALEPAEPHTIAVVLTIDGVRWQEVFEGVDAALAKRQGLHDSEIVPASDLMPSLSALRGGEGAVLGAPGHGAEISASGPEFLSLPAYAEIMTGRAPSRCRNNSCRGISEPTLIDALAKTNGCLPHEAAIVTSWPEIRRVAALRQECVALSTGRGAGYNQHLFRGDPRSDALWEQGTKAGPYPGHGDFRADRLTAAIGLRYLITARPRFLFLGLGETDEYAHKDDYRGYLRALRQADRVVGEVVMALAALRAQGHRTALLVTADHGRADSFVSHGQPFPESARVWLVATGTEIKARGPITASEERRLADLAPTLKTILGLEPDSSERAGRALKELL
jgi:Metalloenzyme superfamily